MVVRKIYESQRDLLIGQLYKRSNTSVASRSYTYDTLARPVTRSLSRDGASVNDSFSYNSRSELNTATVNNEAYAYDYDNIGNRETAQEAAESATSYESNQLNQYTAIGDFEPTYDDAGNQTKVKTSTGIWSVVYNAENRPISFTNEATGTVVECAYDSMGRRTYKKVTTNGNITLHQRYIYRGYLQIVCCDLTRTGHPDLWYITWDSTQPRDTRPLAIRKDGSWFTYGWDNTKNICEIYEPSGYIRTSYVYSPYGFVSSSGSVSQPIQYSSEFHDAEIGEHYYNYRFYNPVDGRWNNRDFILHNNSYSFNPNYTDYIGLSQIKKKVKRTIAFSAKSGSNHSANITDETKRSITLEPFEFYYSSKDTYNLINFERSSIYILGGIYKMDNCSASSSYEYPANKQTYKLDISSAGYELFGGKIKPGFNYTTIIQNSEVTQTGVISLTASVPSSMGDISISVKGTVKDKGGCNFEPDSFSISANLPIYKVNDFSIGAQSEFKKTFADEGASVNGGLKAQYKISDDFSINATYILEAAEKAGQQNFASSFMLQLNYSY